MPDDSFLDGVDVYEALDREVERIAAHLDGRPDDDPEWARASKCEGWTVRDVLTHLLATEDYNDARFSGGVEAFLSALGARGATDIASFNAIGIADHAGEAPSALLAAWRDRVAATVRRFRERGDGTIDTSVGDYPARWQAFHIASELATHADDIEVPRLR